MKSQKTSPDDARQRTPCGQAETGPADPQGAEEASARGDAQAMTQAARSVMHPDRYDLEWRFYHGAVHG